MAEHSLPLLNPGTNTDSRPDIFEVDRDRLTSWLREHGESAYRYEQLRAWIARGRATSFQDMTNLPLGLRQQLSEGFRFWSTHVAHERRSMDGTEKLIVGLADQGQIECVLLRDEGRRTICISTQVGCAMGCVFCASGLDGVRRNLRQSEIIQQMLHLQHRLPSHERLSHIVVMGMGEPLANLNQLLPALGWAQHPQGLGISSRRITISTVGIPSAMLRLAREAPQYHLAVSLHAPTDELRNQLVPTNVRTGLESILSAADTYFEASGRRLTFEYVLLATVNDSETHARQLADRLAGRPAMLNVIPYNPVSGLPYQTPAPARVERFCQLLRARRINVQVRERKGDAIDAACGQLRRTHV